MMYQNPGRASRSGRLFVRLLVGVFASTAFIWGHAPLSARAEPKPTARDSTDRIYHGNGSHNRNILAVRSPTYNHGYQHTSTSTAGGKTSIQNALCKNVTICKIIQKVGPRKAEKPSLNAPGTATPAGAGTLVQHNAQMPALTVTSVTEAPAA